MSFLLAPEVSLGAGLVFGGTGVWAGVSAKARKGSCEATGAVIDCQRKCADSASIGPHPAEIIRQSRSMPEDFCRIDRKELKHRWHRWSQMSQSQAEVPCFLFHYLLQSFLVGIHHPLHGEIRSGTLPRSDAHAGPGLRIER